MKEEVNIHLQTKDKREMNWKGSQRFESRQTSSLNRLVTRRGGGNQVQVDSSRLDTLSSTLRSVQGGFSLNFDLGALFNNDVRLKTICYHD